MTKRSKVKLAQPHTIIGLQRNTRVGDLLGNAAIFRQFVQGYIAGAAEPKPTVIVGPEMGLAGYPLQDTVFTPAFVRDCYRVLMQDIVPYVPNHMAVLVGLPWLENGKLYNAVAWCSGGQVEHVFTKTELPNTGVFDEVRWFASGKPSVHHWQGVTYGVPICEDIWHPRVCKAMAKMGAQMFLSPNGSPFSENRWEARRAVIEARVRETSLPLLYVNRWGGQDELVFDGQSAFVNNDLTTHRAAMYTDVELHLTFDGQTAKYNWAWPAFKPLSWGEECWQHHVVGLRDYTGRHNTGKAVFGLSGGADSALVACLAAEALGPENVTAVLQPSKYSTADTVEDSDVLAKALGLRQIVVPIESMVADFRRTFTQAGVIPVGTADENLQSRTRGMVGMYFSNMGYGMALTTGNKSEMSVGFATLYGDMNGGFNPIKDLYKLEVFRLMDWKIAQYRAQGNTAAADIMQRILDKPPSAGLRENQKDEDSLPPYAVLDPILMEFMERHRVPQEVMALGLGSAADINSVYQLVRKAEFKRRQAPPGTRWHSVDLDKDRRMPLDNAWMPELATDPMAMAAE
ncbi:MAG: NAD+ synthase [Alphaproteobacteria bacterium]